MSAYVTKAQFDALAARVSALEGPAAPTPPPAGSTVPDASTSPVLVPVPGDTPAALTLSTPTVQVDGNNYHLSASATAVRDVTLTYLQIAVRGPSASDLDFHPNAVLTSGQVVTLAASAYGSGDFTAWVAYSLDGSTWVDGPKVMFSIAAAAPPVPRDPGQRRIALVGRSGLGFNSLVFRQSGKDADAFGARRGVPVDGLLFFTPRRSWSDLRYHPADHKAWLDAGRLIVSSMPHAPESEGDSMNTRGADDGYRDQQRAHGKWIVEQGFNVPNYVVRVDWESNGTWYKWSANRGGAAALKASLRNFVVNLRAGGATQVRFDLCWNKGPSQSGADFAVFPGAEFIDVVAVDQYDMWAPAYNESDWDREMNKPPSVKAVAEFAAAQGIMWAWDEGGNTHGGTNMGGDNPVYWEMVAKTIAKYQDTMAWHNTYDDAGAPASLHHDFVSNPKSWAKYQGLFRPAA